jgi:hypothetical protein
MGLLWQGYRPVARPETKESCEQAGSAARAKPFGTRLETYAYIAEKSGEILANAGTRSLGGGRPAAPPPAGKPLLRRDNC